MLFAGCARTAAVVNGEKITIQDIHQELEKRAGKEALEELILRKIVEQEARKHHVTVAPSEIDEKIQQLKKAVGSEKFEAGLKERKVSLEQFKEEVGRNILLRKLVVVSIPEQDIKEYFEKNKDRLPRVEVNLIAVRTADMAKAIAEEIKRGKDFAVLAKQFSVDSRTRDSGGYLGYVPRAMIGQNPVAKTAFEMKIGETSSPIKGDDNTFFVIQVTGKKETYADLKTYVEDEMVGQKVSTFLEKAKEQAKIEYKGAFGKE